MTEHKNYDTGTPCEFRLGKLRGGKILEDRGKDWLIGFYGIYYQEVILSKNIVKLHQI